MIHRYVNNSPQVTHALHRITPCALPSTRCQSRSHRDAGHPTRPRPQAGRRSADEVTPAPREHAVHGVGKQHTHLLKPFDERPVVFVLQLQAQCIADVIATVTDSETAGPADVRLRRRATSQRNRHTRTTRCLFLGSQPRAPSVLPLPRGICR